MTGAPPMMPRVLPLLLGALALAAAGCVRAPAQSPATPVQGPATSVLAAVYETSPDTVRAEAVAALGQRGFGVTEGPGGQVVAFAPTTPDIQLTLGFAPYGRYTRMDARYTYTGRPPEHLPDDFYWELASTLSGEWGTRSALLPIASYTEGQPACADPIDLTPEGVFARSIEDEPDVLEAVEEVPELVGGLDTFRPVYPEVARRQGIEGRVIARVIVELDGSVSCIEAVSGPLELAPAALAAVAAARFTPGLHHDTPVPVRFTLPVNFRLDY